MKLLGGHVSITGGVGNAPERRARRDLRLHADILQEPDAVGVQAVGLEDAEEYLVNMGAHEIRETVIHDSYLINLGSPDKMLLKRSREAFLDEVVRAKHLGVRNLIFHPGAHMGAGEQTRPEADLGLAQLGQEGVRFRRCSVRPREHRGPGHGAGPFVRAAREGDRHAR